MSERHTSLRSKQENKRDGPNLASTTFPLYCFNLSRDSISWHETTTKSSKKQQAEAGKCISKNGQENRMTQSIRTDFCLVSKESIIFVHPFEDSCESIMLVACEAALKRGKRLS